jgi:hypothetical protein
MAVSPFDWLPKAHSSHRVLILARRRGELQATYNRQSDRADLNQPKVRAWKYNMMTYLRWARGDKV